MNEVQSLPTVTLNIIEGKVVRDYVQLRLSIGFDGE